MFSSLRMHGIPAGDVVLQFQRETTRLQLTEHVPKGFREKNPRVITRHMLLELWNIKSSILDFLTLKCSDTTKYKLLVKITKV